MRAHGKKRPKGTDKRDVARDKQDFTGVLAPFYRSSGRVFSGFDQQNGAQE